MEDKKNEILLSVKRDLRRVNDKLNDDILETINYAILDMRRIGVIPDLENPLTIKAIKLYCRWHYNFENQAERYMQNYISLVSAMSMSLDYKFIKDTKDV